MLISVTFLLLLLAVFSMLSLSSFFCFNFLGGVAEWSIAAVLKTVVGVSPPRVRISAPPNNFGELAELVECGGLENRCRRKMTGGSNPPLSASLIVY